ncbi:DUF4870 domain-containing protein [Sphingobacterium pedocola]|uniref:Import component protein n=1 Tax=Sphingobacterium pedocola TaxID=2082722 RepID=A0ABR9TCB4_9SPHI|nr:DUF4870 domain-containing protein [Sphingobacterium pedocola]MBE8722682.1 import component protein [Sphingobacterium pedocola]
MSSKTISMIAYITIIGWLIAFFQSRNTRTPLVKFHLEQALGVFIFSFCWSVILRILFFVIPPLAPVGGILSFVPLVFIILGIINASKEQFTPLPIIGNLIADKIKL